MHGNLRINFTLRSLRISKLSYYLPFQNLQPITAHCISSHLLSKMVCRIHQRGPICFVLSNENIKKNHDILCCFRFLPLSHSYLLSTRSLMYKWKEEIPKEKFLSISYPRNCTWLFHWLMQICMSFFVSWSKKRNQKLILETNLLKRTTGRLHESSK